MTFVDPIASGATTPQSTSMFGALDGEAFMKLLVAQLQFQNPMSPSDPTDMMAQTTQLAQFDAIQQLVALQRRDFGLQEAVAAAGLLGLDVRGVDADGTAVSGTVDGVRYTAGGPVLDIGDHELALGAVTELRTPNAGG